MDFDKMQRTIAESRVFSDPEKTRLTTDLELLRKTASVGTTASDFYRKVTSPAGASAAILGTMAAMGAYGYWQGHHDQKQHEQRLLDSRQAIEPAFQGHPRFQQRFAELALISPTVAGNPRLAERVVRDKLDSGFDLNDVHRLSTIEFNSSNTPRLPSALDSARSQASRGLGAWLTISPLLQTLAFNSTRRQIDDLKSSQNTARQQAEAAAAAGYDPRNSPGAAAAKQEAPNWEKEWKKRTRGVDPEKTKKAGDIMDEILKQERNKKKGGGKP